VREGERARAEQPRQDEMRNLISNANLLGEKVSDYKINGTFETATGTTSVEIKKSRTNTLILISIIAAFLVLASGLGIHNEFPADGSLRLTKLMMILRWWRVYLHLMPDGRQLKHAKKNN
jgi:hypothetical protein